MEGTVNQEKPREAFPRVQSKEEGTGDTGRQHCHHISEATQCPIGKHCGQAPVHRHNEESMGVVPPRHGSLWKPHMPLYLLIAVLPRAPVWSRSLGDGHFPRVGWDAWFGNRAACNYII